MVDVLTQTVFTTNVRDFQCQVPETYSTPRSIFDVTEDHNYAKQSTMSTSVRDPNFSPNISGKSKYLRPKYLWYLYLPLVSLVKMLIMTHPLRSWARVKHSLGKKTLCRMLLLWAIWKCGNLLYLKVCWIYCFGKLNVKDVDCDLRKWKRRTWNKYPYSRYMWKWPSYHWVESATCVWSTSSF